MKYGVRKPNIKNSVKARTTGKLKRQVKKSVNPLYGKKGMGVVNDPKKAVYNSVYNKTTVGVDDLLSSGNDALESNNDIGFFGTVALLFRFLFSFVKVVFWLAIVIGIIALLIWIF